MKQIKLMLKKFSDIIDKKFLLFFNKVGERF